MPRNALTQETKSEQWRSGFPPPDDKVRLGPTVVAILDRFRRASHTQVDQLRLGALKTVFIECIVDERFEDAYDALGALTGRNVPNGVCLRCGGQAVIEGTPSGNIVPRRELR